jgi:hypothetical protein
VIGWIGEPVYVDVVALRVIDLANPRVQLVVRDAAPEFVWMENLTKTEVKNFKYLQAIRFLPMCISSTDYLL